MLVTLIFALNILGSSAAYGAVVADGPVLVENTGLTDSEQPCQKKIRAAKNSLFASCPVAPYRVGSHNPCPVDIAPIVDIIASYSAPCRSLLRSGGDPGAADWRQRPIIGPPRLG